MKKKNFYRFRLSFIVKLLRNHLITINKTCILVFIILILLLLRLAPVRYTALLRHLSLGVLYVNK